MQPLLMLNQSLVHLMTFAAKLLATVKSLCKELVKPLSKLSAKNLNGMDLNALGRQ